MKKALLMATAILAAVPAWAESQWVLVGEGDTSGKWYIDLNTLRTTGPMRRVWVLNDMPKPDKDGDRSSRSFYEVDCQEQRLRSLQASFYKGKMGSGSPSGSSTIPGSWSYAAPDTIGNSVVEVVCGR